MAPPVGRSRLPELLSAKKLSQVDLATKLNVSEAFISQVIKGTRIFSLPVARKASKILGCRIEDLHEWNDD